MEDLENIMRMENLRVKGYIDDKRNGTSRLYDEGEITYSTKKMINKDLKRKILRYLSPDRKIEFKYDLVYDSMYIDDERNGISRTYYENGQLLSEVTYVGDKLNGQLQSEDVYVDDKKNGISKTYDEDGQLWIDEVYVDNKRNGISRSYHDNGKLQIEETYVDNKRNGISRYYHTNGQLLYEGMYINDKRNGIGIVPHLSRGSYFSWKS